jgi:rRNA-processing protein FCF1
VLLVGNIDRRLVGRIGKTDKYTREDYERITEVLEQFNRFIIVPQVLTEAGNMLKRNCPTANTLLDLSLELKRFVHSEATRESRASSKRITIHPAFEDLGYADAAILHVAAGRHLVFTDDGPLKGLAWSSGVDVLPFDWLRAI